METDKYSLRYIPGFETDLHEIIEYIAVKLNNPDAAFKLIDKIDKAITDRLNYPLSFQPFPSNRKRKHQYYPIYVDNFTVYYVVIDNVMEFRRILYKGRNMADHLTF